MVEDPEYKEIIENFQTSIKYPYSSRVGWITYRITDEVLKRLYLKKMAESFMPLNLKEAGMNLKTSNNMLNNLPMHMFDTL